MESRIASMLPNLALGTSTLGNKFKPIPPAQPITSSVSQPIQSYTAPQPVKTDMEDNSDERAATPVMDEQEEEKEPTPPRVQSPEKPKPAATTPSTTSLKTNPIDFLSQLLTKTTKSSSSSNFLHSLSLLTNTVKSQYQQKQQPDVSSSSGQSNRMMDTTLSTAAPVSENSSPVSVGPSQVEAPLSSTWSGWKINAAHPPLPPQPSPDQPPPPMPAVPIAGPPPGPGLLPQQPAYPPPQPPSPLPTPPALRFPSAGNQNYPNIPDSSQGYQVPLSSGFQPRATEAFNPASVSETFTAPGSQPYQVASSQSDTQGYIDPSLPPPPPTSQAFQLPQRPQFPASPEPMPPRPPPPTSQSFQPPSQQFAPSPDPLPPSPNLMGPRPGFPQPGETRPGFPLQGEIRPSFPPPGEARPSFPPPGETKGLNLTSAFNQLIFSYGGVRNPPPSEPVQEQRPFVRVPAPWDPSVPNPPAQHEPNQGFTQSSRPWDHPPPGPPPEPNSGPPNQFQPQGAYTPWSQPDHNERPGPGPAIQSVGGPPNQFPTEEAYTPWDQPQVQVKPNEYGDQWEQPDMEIESPPPEPEAAPSPPVQNNPTPAKGILRHRNSSLREVTLVDEPNSGTDSFTPGDPQGERIPVGILKKLPFSTGIKKPPTDIVQTDQPSDVQSEFIAKLKRKTGSSNLVVPPMTHVHSVNSRNTHSHGRQHSNLTTIEPTPAHLLTEHSVDNVHKDPNVHEMVLEEVEENNDNQEPDTEASYEGNIPGGYEHNGANLDRSEQEHEKAYQHVDEHGSGYQGSGQEHFGAYQHQQGGNVEPLRSYQEGEQSQNEGQFHTERQLGEPISTIGAAGDRDSRSSNDMDLETEEENQVPETLPPQNRMIEIEEHHAPVIQVSQAPQEVEQWQRDHRPENEWHDRREKRENWHPKFERHERYPRPHRPRFDHFRPREPFSPYHRPFHDRGRSPRPFYPGPRPRFYRY